MPAQLTHHSNNSAVNTEGLRTMEIHHETIDGGILQVRLTGTLDVAGSDQIGLTFNALAGTETRMLVDLSGVDFLASMGIRLLLTVGKAVVRRRGRIVLCAAQPVVREVLVTTGIDKMFPMAERREAALAVLSAA